MAGQSSTPQRPNWGPTSVIESIVATTRPVLKYTPPERLTVEALEQLAEQLLTNAMPTLFGHDYTKPFPLWFESAETRLASDGETELIARIALPTSNLEDFLTELEASGGPGGLSYSRREPLGVVSAGDADGYDSGNFPLRIGADGLFPKADLVAAATILGRRSQLAVEVDRTFSFSADEVLTVVLTIGTLAANVSYGVLGNAAWEAIKRLRAGREHLHTAITIERIQPDGEVLRAVVATSDNDVARSALEQLPVLGTHHRDVAVFDSAADSWNWPERPGPSS